jgi:lincosamide and streptogramin A transport system ATP-binding/permease protein
VSSILIKHVDFNYDSPYKNIFTDLDLVLDTSWRTGLVGRNGQGKSTLLALLAGKLQPLAGRIEVSEQTIYFPGMANKAELTLHVIKDAVAPFRAWEATMASLLADGSCLAIAEYSVLQELFQASGGYEIDANLAREFAELGLNHDLLERPFGSLSGGEQTRALMSCLFCVDGLFPLIDEPTNHLDAQGRWQVADYLAKKSGFLLVSHDRQFLDRSIDHVVSINKNDVQVNRGSYSSWKQHMAEIELAELRARENIKREVKHLKKVAQQRREGALSREVDKHTNDPSKGGSAMLNTGRIGHTAAKQMKRALAAERRIDGKLETKATLLKNQEKDHVLKIQTSGQQRQALLIANNISFAYNQTDDSPLIFDNVSLTVNAGERIAISGANGCGKSTLLRVLAGDLAPIQGVVKKPNYVTVSRAYQHPLWQNGSLHQQLVEQSIDESRFRQTLGAFGLQGEVFDRPLETFSQGQLKKVDLARSMLTDADYLIWDEPMNYIDVFSREQIEVAILESLPTMIFVEHDQTFIDRVATTVIQL